MLALARRFIWQEFVNEKIFPRDQSPPTPGSVVAPAEVVDIAMVDCGISGLSPETTTERSPAECLVQTRDGYRSHIGLLHAEIQMLLLAKARTAVVHRPGIPPLEP
jgi:hypothetical protein